MTKAVLPILILVVTLGPIAVAAQPPMPEVILDNPSVRVTIVTYPPGRRRDVIKGSRGGVGTR